MKHKRAPEATAKYHFVPSASLIYADQHLDAQSLSDLQQQTHVSVCCWIPKEKSCHLSH